MTIMSPQVARLTSHTSKLDRPASHRIPPDIRSVLVTTTRRARDSVIGHMTGASRTVYRRTSVTTPHIWTYNTFFHRFYKYNQLFALLFLNPCHPSCHNPGYKSPLSKRYGNSYSTSNSCHVSTKHVPHRSIFSFSRQEEYLLFLHPRTLQYQPFQSLQRLNPPQDPPRVHANPSCQTQVINGT